MARRSVHGSRAQGRVESAFEVFEGVLHRFLDVFLRVPDYPHGVDGNEHGAEAFALRRHDGSWFRADRTLVGRASLPSGGSGRGALGQRSPVAASRSSNRRDRAGRPVWRSCPAAGRRPGPSGCGQRTGPYVGRRCYWDAARLFGSAVAVVSLLLRKTAGCAHRIDVRVDGFSCVEDLRRVNHPGRTEAVPDVSGHSSRRANQFQRCWGALPRPRLGRLGATEIGRWRRPE